MMKILKNKFDLKNLDKYQKPLIKLIKSWKLIRLKKLGKYHVAVCDCGSLDLGLGIHFNNGNIRPMGIYCRGCRKSMTFYYDQQDNINSKKYEKKIKKSVKKRM